MQNSLLCAISILLLLPTLVQPQEQPPDDVFRAMTFNIRFDTPDDGEDAWPNRKDKVASMIRFHRADIVGIQEGLHHQLEDMNERLPPFTWIGVGRDDGDSEGEFSAIFYDTDRFELLDNNTFWLSETPSEPSIGWDADFPRVVTWIHLRDRSSDRTFYVFNTHFDHRGEEARYNSAQLIRQSVDEIAGDEPVIVMGDFNVTEDEAPYEVMTSTEEQYNIDLVDAFYSSHHDHHGPTSTWTAFEEIHPDRRIDYIFVNDQVDVIQHGILADVWDGRFPSDHLPVLAELSLSQ